MVQLMIVRGDMVDLWELTFLWVTFYESKIKKLKFVFTFKFLQKIPPLEPLIDRIVIPRKEGVYKNWTTYSMNAL